MSSLKDKVTLITGASTGIGAGIAAHFASLGCKVVLVARSVENLKKSAENCKKAGLPNDKILVVPADLSKDQDVENVIKKTVEKFGRLDVLVNNAATATQAKRMVSMPLKEYDEIMNLNVRSVFYLTQLAVPYLTKTQGNVVNISSVAGMKTFANSGVYSMGKAALDHFTRNAASEFAEYKIRVNSVNPGFVSTPIHQKAFPGATEEMMNGMVQKTTTLGRMGTAEEIAKAVAFLASDDGSYITGVCLPVDGGVLIHNVLE